MKSSLIELISHSLQGYENLGFSRRGNKTVYREWAPGAKAAALIGDFNKWEPTWMEKDEWGVWSVELPDGMSAPQHATACTVYFYTTTQHCFRFSKTAGKQGAGSRDINVRCRASGRHC